MRRNVCLAMGALFGFFSVLLAGPVICQAKPLSADQLRTEYKTNPLGIDVRRPRLSWIVRAKERGQRQTAYRLLVASSPEVLVENRGDLWDSGRVKSHETVAVVYAGTPLTTARQAFWKVKVWDKAKQPSAWSDPAMWSMGLLEPADWQAHWIGLDCATRQGRGDELSRAFQQANWIWSSPIETAQQAPVARRAFRRDFTLPDEPTTVRAELAVAADNRATVTVNGQEVGEATKFTSGQRFDVTPQLRPGKNCLAIDVENAGDAPNPAGLLGVLVVEFADGGRTVIPTDAKWKTSDAPGEDWTKPDFDAQAWQAASVLGQNGIAPWNGVAVTTLHLPPPRYVRTEFELAKPIRRATLYGSALGLYQLHLNGRPVGDDYFTPGWTDYDQRVYYQTYDVTDRVVQGANAVGGVIADGWYAGYVGFGGQRDLYGDKIRLRAQLVVEFTDGTSRVIATGADWKGSTGPLEEADFLMGERYDARKEMPGWDRSGFDVAAWHRVDVTESIAARVEAHPGPPVGRLPSIKPVRVTQPQKGRFVVDLGQNFAGMVRLKVRGPRGQEITLRHAERLNPDGTIYTKNLRSARAIDHYVCRGGGDVEVWQPRFTFHGFQYVEVTGYPGTLTADDVTGIPLSSDTPVTGRFECSDPMVNKLIRNIYWTQRMNFIDVPTDCPQRDERLGWTGDAQIYVHAASLIADTQAFFTKWLVDLTDAQRADGQFPMVAPLKSKGVSADGGPAWADAGVICPWTIYEMYGDRRILERHYASMAKFIKFCKNRSTSDLLPPEKFHCFGDWLSIRADTPKDVIYMAYFAHSTRLMSRIAAALDKKEDAARYEQLFQRIKSSFNVAYVQPDGRIKGNTQTCYVLAIAFDLVDGTRRDQAAQYLIDDIRERDWHLSTGFIGTKDLMLVLSQIDRTDVAYRLLHNTTFPSWGFSIEQGATSIWERWNGWTPEDGFFNPGMNSFAHYSFGAVAQWIFGTVGGINTQGAGFQRIVLCPQPGGKLTWAKTDYQSVHGEIVTDWKRDGDGVRLRVVIPANTTATVYVPVVEGAVVQEGDQPANEAPGVQLLRRTETAAVYEVGSGEYIFSSGAKEGGAR